MNNNLIYQYPTEDYLNEYEKNFKSYYKKQKRNVILSISFLILGCICFAVYSLFYRYESAKYILVISILFLFAGFLLLKSSVKNSSPHQLAIEAYEDHMTITYYTYGKFSKRILKADYNDIISARFTNNEYSGFQISFNKTAGTYLKSFDRKGREIKNAIDNLFLFSINPMSFEQGFFLYIANDLFSIDKFKFGRKELKKFGTQEEYFYRLEDEME